MSDFLFPIIEIVLGVVLLFAGGELFIQGAIFLSLVLGIPQIVIGLTVVSLGTSSPELLVSLSSILKGSDSLAASNVIGSNIFNVLVVLGISSLITPLKVKSRIVRRDVPLLMAISCAVWAMSSTGLLTLQAGVFLIFCLILNTIWEINTINEKGEETKDAEPEIEEIKNEKFDLVFIDADKMNYIEYYELSLQLLNQNGLIIIDNVLWYGEVVNENNNDKFTTNIKEFNSHISEDTRVEKLIIPLGDGMTVCRKL